MRRSLPSRGRWAVALLPLVRALGSVGHAAGFALHIGTPYDARGSCPDLEARLAVSIDAVEAPPKENESPKAREFLVASGYDHVPAQIISRRLIPSIAILLDRGAQDGLEVEWPSLRTTDFVGR